MIAGQICYSYEESGAQAVDAVCPPAVNPAQLLQHSRFMHKPAVRLTPWLFCVVAMLQLAWMCWFLSTPLPNATPVGSGSSISRGLLLFSTTPGLNPGFRWSQSLFGQAFDELSGFRSVVDRLPVVAIGFSILAGAWGLGLASLQQEL